MENYSVTSGAKTSTFEVMTASDWIQMPRLRLLLLALFAYRAFDQKPWVVVG